MSCTAAHPHNPIVEVHYAGSRRPRRAAPPAGAAKLGAKNVHPVLLRRRAGTTVAVDDAEPLLAEENLHHCEKMQVIGNLAAGMAHDLNNALAIVDLNLFAIERELPPGSAAEKYMSDALNALWRGAGLIKDMLSYARGQAFETVRLDVADLLRQQRGFLSRTLGAQVTVETDIAPAVPAVAVNPSQLQTALLNLAINAKHSMPYGGKLLLSLREVVNDPTDELPPGRYAVITVSDTGLGMSPEVRKQAFDLFFSTKGELGTGLGLPLVRRFARQSGGGARVYSAMNEGTRVEVWLPTAA